ncbi:MAG: sarcosine oxidase subunit gamma family protein [Alphaproteobacteria bacterium]
MAEATRLSPLARLGLAARIGETDAPLRLGWATPAAMLVVRGDPPADLDLPRDPNTVAGDNPRAFWLGPDEWLLVGDVDRAALGDAVAVDVSHARTVITVAGDDAVDLLAKACGLDFDESAFPVDGCAQSKVALTSALLHRTDTDRFELYVGRSYAVYLWQWLADAAAEFGYAVAGLDQSGGSSR